MKNTHVIRLAGACVFAVSVYISLHSFIIAFVARLTSAFGR